MENLTTTQKTLLNALNLLILTYNNKKGDVNYLDLRNLEQYILDQGVSFEIIKKYTS